MLARELSRRGFHVTGIDASAEMLRFANEHGAPDTAMRRLSGFTDSAVIPFVH